MSQFVEIINSDLCESFTNLVLDGIPASTKEWSKHNFWPNNGVVGIVVGDGHSANGPIIVIQAMTNIFIPILPSGVKSITEYEFRQKVQNNSKIGLDINQKNKTAERDELLKSMNNMFNF